MSGHTDHVERLRAYGEPVIQARMRTAPEDFQVDEIAGFEPSGEGEHLLLEIRKRGENTAFVAAGLAAWANVVEHAVGYAGLKDRHAVTTQRFSVHFPKRVSPPLESLDLPGVEVISSTWHSRKLPRGALEGNRFTLRLREVSGDRAAIESRLQVINQGGLPNYFGEQRFGRDGGNIASARAMFAGRRMRKQQRSILLSAARSLLFNAVLARRVTDGSWATGAEGELWMLDGSHSLFGPEPMDDTLMGRVASLDIHPTGPLWGRGQPRVAGAVAALEAEVLEAFCDIRAGLEAAGLKMERRALRIRVGGLEWEWDEEGALVLRFSLPPGAYATGLLHELGDITDAAQPAPFHGSGTTAEPSDAPSGD